jgi:hypothetical protein
MFPRSLSRENVRSIGAEDNMSKQLNRKSKKASFNPARIFWTIMGMATFLAMVAGAVAFSLRHQHPVPEVKLYFMFGASLLAVVLLLIAQVWRDRMLGT